MSGEQIDQQGLRLELGQAREQLDELLGALRAVEAELEDVRHTHELLHRVCDGLAALDAAGAAELFWDGRAGPADAAEHLRQVRGRAEGLEKRMGEIEDRRQVLGDRIDLAQEKAEILEADVFDAWRLEEERKLEWVIEREPDDLPAGAGAARMPWSRGGEDDERFRRTLASSLLLALLFALLFPWIDLPLPERGEPLEVPERLTRLIREEQPPPPAPVVPQTRPEELEPVEELAKQEPKETTPAAEPNAEPAEPVGILAFREKFSGLAENKPAARLGRQARIQNDGCQRLGGSPRSRSMPMASRSG